MKRLLPCLLGLVLALGVAGLPLNARAAGAAAKADGKTAVPTHAVPGAEQMAKMISIITGVAISPLLGMGAVGAWEYFHWQKLPEQERGPLPWYANPLFWLPALLVVGLIGAKDVLGTAAPSALKKPFDIAELIENKISGLIAAGLFIPIAASMFSQHPTTSAFAGTNLAVIDGAAFWNVLLVPVAVVTFAVVWLVSHAIHVLIVISPFTTVDTARHTMSNDGFKLRRQLGSTPLSRYIDCGTTQIGENADSYEVFITVVAQLEEDERTGLTAMHTTFEAMARPIAFSREYSRCSSKGVLEKRLADAVTAQLQ